MISRINETQTAALAELDALTTGEGLEQFRTKYLGPKGALKELMGLLKDVPPAEKPAFGQAANALRKGSWGAQPVPGLEPQSGDHIVSKMRMSAWEGTNLETILKAEDRDILIDTGAWTNMSIEHTARTGADKGYIMIVPEDACSTMNADWHRAATDYALQNVAAVTTTEESFRPIVNMRPLPTTTLE